MQTYKICVIGVGYVGLELAIHLAKHFPTIGFDNNIERIEELKTHYDKNQLISKAELQHKNLCFTNTVKDIKNCNVYIICVPTPLLFYKIPDISLLFLATDTVASVLKNGDWIIYESSVYPGTTEELCLPILEEKSGLHEGFDFFLAYSPERVNPGDGEHTLKNITKLIAVKTPNMLGPIKSIYEKICKQVFCCSNIKIAEASKILENTQRDVNIALMNEFTQIMHALNVNMQEVITAASTKFNFSNYFPGLVGGHCISIDPEYIAFLAHQHGVSTPLISNAREVNNHITQFLLNELLKLLMQYSIKSKIHKIGIFGLTYKPNIPDTRNSLVFKFIKECHKYPFILQLHDPFFESKTAPNSPNFKIDNFADLNELDVCMIFVNHRIYKEFGLKAFVKKCKKPILVMDIANTFYDEKKPKNINYWHL